MALAADGAVVGSISGGCVEDDLMYRLSSEPRAWRQAGESACTFMRYGVSADEARRFGLPCGGTLELVAEFDPDAGALTALVDALVAGQLMRRRVRLADGMTSLAPATVPEALVMNEETISQTFGPGYRMLLIGAGQLAE